MTPKKRTRQFAALLIASALSVSVSNSAVASQKNSKTTAPREALLPV